MTQDVTTCAIDTIGNADIIRHRYPEQCTSTFDSSSSKEHHLLRRREKQWVVNCNLW
jgi:hypothetical protein